MKTKPFWILAALLVALGVGCARADQMRDVNIYAYLTEAGKKIVPPTTGRPAICLIINGGYHEVGSIVAGEKPPAPEKVGAIVTKALDAAHYLDVQAQKTPRVLDYIIVYSWGCMNPKIQESGSDDVSDDADVSPTVSFNGASMIALVAGDSINRMMPNTIPWEEAMQAAEDPRYFVFIAAYSPAAYFKNNKREKKLLWRAQMSLPSNGVTMNQSIDALVYSSVAYLGRPTDLPKHVFENLDRPSQVIVGTPETKEFLPATDSSKPNDPQKK